MYLNTKKTLPDGRVLNLRFFAGFGSGAATLGCHSAIITGVGGISIIGCLLETRTLGIKTGELKLGNLGPSSVTWLDAASVQKISKEVGGDEVLRDICWEVAAKALTSGIYIFSDRVNRGSPSSSMPSGSKLGSANTCTAAFGKFLESRPDLGRTVVSPLFNNPNHHASTDFGLMRVWMFIPTLHPRRIVVDEKDGLEPLWKYFSTTFDEKEPQKKIYLTHG